MHIFIGLPVFCVNLSICLFISLSIHLFLFIPIVFTIYLITHVYIFLEERENYGEGLLPTEKCVLLQSHEFFSDFVLKI